MRHVLRAFVELSYHLGDGSGWLEQTFLPMAPKQKPIEELGTVVQNGNGWRACVKIGAANTYGPTRATEEDAWTDIRRARGEKSREDMQAFLETVKIAETAEAPAAAISQKRKKQSSHGKPISQPQEDGRKSNRGTSGNRGGSGRPSRLNARTPKENLSKFGRARLFLQTCYRIEHLDLSLAQLAMDLSTWPDQYTVSSLMRLLVEQKGCLQIKAYHLHSNLEGRLLSEWPTLLHVNRSFRACLLYPQRDRYMDLDMQSSHNHIAQYYAVYLGIIPAELLVYLRSKTKKHAELLAQGLEKRDVKQLWLSLLNSGGLSGWLHGLTQKYGGHRVTLSNDLREHLKRFKAEVLSIRSALLAQEEWAQRRQKWRTRWPKLSDDALNKKLWNFALTSMESKLMRELETMVHSGVAGLGRVCMPSYDGFLVHHAPGAVDVATLCKQWNDHCQSKYTQTFPIEAKDYAADVPKWVLRLADVVTASGSDAQASAHSDP